MTKHEVLSQIGAVRLVPVLRASSADEAIAMACAIEAGGISILEVTMTVPGALEVIGRLVKEKGERILIGAGTVLDPETARACMLAGAQFIVSPALNFETVRLCRRYSVPVFPGALTPSEVVSAWEAGADAVKIFPCSAMGGAKYLRALKAPFPHIEMIPTGGVSQATARDFLDSGAFALGVGAELADCAAIRAGRSESITENARRYVELVQSATQVSLAGT